jgi:hypothetical protein
MKSSPTITCPHQDNRARSNSPQPKQKHVAGHNPGDTLRHLVLEVENVSQRAIEAVGPEMRGMRRTRHGRILTLARDVMGSSYGLAYPGNSSAEARLVRFIDDFVICFQYRSDAIRVQDALRLRWESSALL